MVTIIITEVRPGKHNVVIATDSNNTLLSNVEAFTSADVLNAITASQRHLINN